MNVAFIPVRGGSKSIKKKNIKMIAGKPLVYWTSKAANDCEKIDKVYIATDDDEIRETVNGFGLPKIEVIDRSKETATDTASTESVMLEFAERYEFDNIVLIQATSPLLTCEDLLKGFAIYEKEDVDSVLSAVAQKRFIWLENDYEGAIAQNYDIYNRPRRQDMSCYYVENGAFYITNRDKLIKTKNRVSGKIGICSMPEDTYYEIDEPTDWKIIESLLNERNTRKRNIPDIKLFLTDCDGCLTDGGMYYSENGDEIKRFNAKDGMGFKLLRERGIITGIITGEERELNIARAKKLQVDELFQGVKNKANVIKNLCEKYNIPLENVAYVGDDINDIEALVEVGFGCTVSNAQNEVKKHVKYIAERNGGDAAVREIIDLIINEN